MSEIGQEAFPDDRKWLVCPLGGPGVAGRPTQMSGCGREALTNARE